MVCKPEESKAWYEKLWRYSVELFRSLDIPVRQLECCSGDLADLKCRSCDIEAWSPRQQKYFEVCSCSNLGDAQARRLKIRYKDDSGKMQLCHTLNNTCVAPPGCSSPCWKTISGPMAACDPQGSAALYGRHRGADPPSINILLRRKDYEEVFSGIQRNSPCAATCWTWPWALW